jgi:integrase
VLAIGAALVGCDVLEPIIGQAGGGAVGMAKECGRYAPLVRMLAYTGLRWGEVAALRIHEVDLDRRRIHVVASVTEVDGRLVWGTPKTHAPRTVPLPRFVTRELALLAEGRAPDDLLFTAPRGGVLRVRNFRRNVFDPPWAESAPLLPPARAEAHCGLVSDRVRS